MNLEKTLEIAVPIFLIASGIYIVYEIKKDYDEKKEEQELKYFVEKLRKFGL